eukprot:456836_1
MDPNEEKKIFEAKKQAIKQRLTEFIASPIGGAITSYKSYLIYLNNNGLHKIGTGYHNTIGGKIYNTIRDIYLSNDNIAWMTTWIYNNYKWILIRFRYDNIKSNNNKLSGKIYVIDADKFVILGEIHANGKGSIQTDDNSKYNSLGNITTNNGPIYVNQEDNTLCAFLFNETFDDIITFKVEQFKLPKLTYIIDMDVFGPSKKKSKNGGSKMQDANAYGWGQNGSGGLGINDTSAKYAPTALHLLPKIRFEKCFAGNETSFFITMAG